MIVPAAPQSKRWHDTDGQRVNEAQTHKNTRSHRQPAAVRTSHLTSADEVLGKDNPSLSYYHAAKWGIEGFCETIARKTAAFGVAVTIIEPGATPTGFGNSLDAAPPLPEYENTPAAQTRRGHFPVPTSTEKITR